MSTHYKGSKKEEMALNAWIKLARANNTVFKSIKPSMVVSNLSTTQFAVLETLWHLGPMSQTTIGNKLLRTSGNIVKVLDNLERVGLVSRTQNESDRRAHQIILTAEGKKLITSAFPDHVKSIIKTFSTLDENELIELSRLCKKLGIGQLM